MTVRPALAAVLCLVLGAFVGRVAAEQPKTELPPATVGRCTVVWEARTRVGEPFTLRRLAWTNPRPGVPVRAVTVTSVDAEVVPAVFALTGLE